MTFKRIDDVNYLAIQPSFTKLGNATFVGISVGFDNLTDKACLNIWFADDTDNLDLHQEIIEGDDYKHWDKSILSTFQIVINKYNLTAL